MPALRRTQAALGTAVGIARVDQRTKDLIKRLQPGDVAVIDHEDLDRVAAEGLVEAGVGAVVNAAQSISGRYPNVGPLLVAAAGIPLIDGVGSGVMMNVREGQLLRIDGETVRVGEDVVATGERQTLQSLEEAYDTAKRNMGDELERFAINTLEFMQRERHLLLEAPKLPPLRTDFRRRHVLVVVRGHDYREDLAHLTSYVHEMRPILLGVDGGADALFEFGLKPDIILGDFDSVSDRALRSGAELVVHAYPDGRAPGSERLRELGVEHVEFAANGTSEDIAMLLAYESGAELIVAVGTHVSMVDFLDKGRAGMASTFLVRLKVGPILVDAKGVSRLYQGRIRKRDMTMFLAAAMLCFIIIAVVVVPDVLTESVTYIFRDLWRSLTH